MFNDYDFKNKIKNMIEKEDNENTEIIEEYKEYNINEKIAQNNGKEEEIINKNEINKSKKVKTNVSNQKRT